MHRHLGTTPAQRDALELLTSGHTNTIVDKNTGGARLAGHAPFPRRALDTHRRVQGVVGQVQAEVVPLRQLQVLEDDIK